MYHSFLVLRRTEHGGWVDLRSSLDELAGVDKDWSASPLFRLCGERFDALPTDCLIVFLFPTNVRALGYQLTRTFGSSTDFGLYLTHGLASIVGIGSEAAIRQLLSVSTEDTVLAWEQWVIREGMTARNKVQLWQATQPSFQPLPRITDDGLPEIAAAQIRQFNANISMLVGQARRCAPDLVPLFVSIHTSMLDVAEEIRTVSARNDFESFKEAHSKTSEFIEVNSALTLLASQAFSAVPSLLDGRYCVAEYSLLGIGGMIRGLWRLYKRLEDVFFEGGMAQRVRAKFPNDRAFPVFKDRSQFQPSEWTHSPLATGGKEVDDDTVDYNIPYFSSRWGFHETLHTISASWQCIHSGSRPQWNLLTMTHEFLHTHAHQLLETLFPVNPDEHEELVLLYNSGRGRKTKSGYDHCFDSTRVAIVVALVQLNDFAEVLSTPQIGTRRDLTKRISLEDLRRLRQNHWWYLNEIIVHVLDFLYVYNGNEAAYVESLWQSWSLVPKVAKSIRHYLQRTLCALSAISPPNVDTAAAFRDAYGLLKDTLQTLVSRNDGKGSRAATPVMAEALRICQEQDTRDALRVEFEATHYIVCLARNFLHDSRIHTKLMADEIAEPGEIGTRYQLEVGEFPERVIESPVAFLLDRFVVNTDEWTQAFASVWQLLVLVEGRDG